MRHKDSTGNAGRWLAWAAVIVIGGAAVRCASAQSLDPALFQDLKWRMIGPFRGGRTPVVAGVPGEPNVYYIASVNGGVWKSTDYSQTYQPIFDGQPTGSIGSLAIAPSNHSIIYVGSGEGLQRPDLSTGDGIYKSVDGGKTWRHLGLRDGQQIPVLLVDPHDPNRVYAAVLGHPYGANAERGVFRSTNGGETWKKVLYKDENTGAIDLQFDPSNPGTLYAAMWAARRPPWTTGGSIDGPGSGLYKSTDGGDTWKPLAAGLPGWAQRLGRIGVGIAPGNPRRIYALVDARRQGGLYRSDDAGASWRRVNTERRIWGRGDDFACVRVDPVNADEIYVANTSTYRSTDAGQNFTAIKGAPGGDDYHTIWISPQDRNVILLGSDQGATLSVNGGATWSSWYNQPTAEFYHVATDNRFPYWVYGAQQESGSAAVESRGNDGEITFREFHPVGVEEYGYVAPDPLHPNLVYGGKVTRFDWNTGQTQNVSPVALRNGKYRFNRTAPLVFSLADPHLLYLGSNVLFETANGGRDWTVISPDLTRPAPGAPPNLGSFKDLAAGEHRGVIYTIAPSIKDANLIWVGTDDGQIQVTRDGGQNWANVTPPELTPWSKVAMLEASHFDAQTAYAAVNRLRLDDLRPYVYRTRDGGKSWVKIASGLPADAPVNVVREDPQRQGLLFAGTERSVYVSFDDGANWQPLRLNLPATSVRDLVIHKDDLVAGTHGRSFWILDNLTPLREISASTAGHAATLFKPQIAYRIRRDTNTDTPLPPEFPAGKNPADGAMIDYTLGAGLKGPVTVEILDANDKLVRRYSSDDPPQSETRKLNVPLYWVRPPHPLSAAPGMHRLVWDLHYPTIEGLNRNYPIAAIAGDTPLAPRGVRAMPGEYTVRLTAGGQSLSQPLTLEMDPRVEASQSDLRQQFELETAIASALTQDGRALEQAGALLEGIAKALAAERTSSAIQELRNLDQEAAQIEGTPGGYQGTVLAGADGRSLARLHSGLAAVYAAVDSADAAPTTAQRQALQDLQSALAGTLDAWQALRSRGLPVLNRELQKVGLQPLAIQ